MSNDYASTQNTFPSTNGTIVVPATFPTKVLVTGGIVSVTPGQSGQLFSLAPVGATITMPGVSISRGCSYSFQMINNNSVTAWTITFPTGTLYGLALGASATFLISGDTTLLFATGALKGDRVDASCDGYLWNVKCYSTAAAASTSFSVS